MIHLSSPTIHWYSTISARQGVGISKIRARGTIYNMEGVTPFRQAKIK